MSSILTRMPFLAVLLCSAFIAPRLISAAVQFSPPVLVAMSTDTEAEQNLPVVPDRFFGLQQRRVFGYHGGKKSFDFTSDEGKSWSSPNITAADWGDTGGIAVPVFQGKTSRAFTGSPVAYHDLGSVAVSSSASGWSRRNVTSILVDKHGQLSASLDHSSMVTFSGIPSPGINTSVSQPGTPQRMYERYIPQ